MKIQPRRSLSTVYLRGHAGRPSDEVLTWTRVISGTQFEFSRIAWKGGREGTTTTVRRAGAETLVHKWSS